MKILTVPDKSLREECAPFPFEGPGTWTESKLGRTLMLMLDAMYLAYVLDMPPYFTVEESR